MKLFSFNGFAIAAVIRLAAAFLFAGSCGESGRSSDENRWRLVVSTGSDTLFVDHRMADSSGVQVGWVKIISATIVHLEPLTRNDSLTLEAVDLFDPPAYTFAYVKVDCASRQLGILSARYVKRDGNPNTVNGTGQLSRVTPESQEESILDGVCTFTRQR